MAKESIRESTRKSRAHGCDRYQCPETRPPKAAFCAICQLERHEVQESRAPHIAARPGLRLGSRHPGLAPSLHSGAAAFVVFAGPLDLLTRCARHSSPIRTSANP